MHSVFLQANCVTKRQKSRSLTAHSQPVIKQLAIQRSYSISPGLWFYAPGAVLPFATPICISRGSVRSTRCLGPTTTARGQSIGISIGTLPQTLIISITVQKTSKYYTTEFDLEKGFFLNGACISISSLPENIAWQIHRPEARGPLKSGAWGGRTTCHPQTPPLCISLIPPLANLPYCEVYVANKQMKHTKIS